jgi:hypothetical protein
VSILTLLRESPVVIKGLLLIWKSELVLISNLEGAITNLEGAITAVPVRNVYYNFI